MTTLDVTEHTPAAGSREALSLPKDCSVDDADARRALALTPHLLQTVRTSTELTLTFSPAADRAALADVATAATRSRKPSAGTVKKSAGLIAALGVACVACLIPGLAVGGAGIFAAGAIGADEVLMGAAAVGLLAYAITTVVRRRRAAAASSSDGCGC